MNCLEIDTAAPASVWTGIRETVVHNTIVLSPTDCTPRRRILYVNNYGGAGVWNKVKEGSLGVHHLWGCLGLVRMGYEVALAEAIEDFVPRRPLPHDLRLLRLVTSWLRNDDIIYCGHNVLFWIPLLKKLNLLKRSIVSLLFARETLAFAPQQSALVALTPAAEAQARSLAPKTKVAHLGWGVDLAVHPWHVYTPEYFLHCGIAGRDFPTLAEAAANQPHRVKLVSSWPAAGVTWSPNVEIATSGPGYNFQDKKISWRELLDIHYARSAATLITTIPNPAKDHALGFTNLIEALAMGQPIIQTRTGALIDELDVEREGCGITVAPGDPGALAAAMRRIMDERDCSEEMGRMSRKVCEQRYTIGRFTNALHSLFEGI